MPEKLEIIITGDSKTLVAELKKAGVEVTKFGDEAKKGSDGTKTFGTSVKDLARELGPSLGLAAVTKGVFEFGKASIQAADEARQVGLTFENLSGGAETAAANMDAIARATTVAGRQMVDETSRMQIANQLLGMGIANTAGELEQVIGVSRRLGSEFRGMGAAEAANEFAIMMSNMSVQRLDSFGISSGKVRQRIDELMSSTKDMTREQAFFQATMEEANSTIARLGPEVATTAQAAQASASAWEDFKGSFGELLTTVGDSGGIFDTATDVITDMTDGAKGWIEFINLAKAMAIAGDAADGAAEAQSRYGIGTETAVRQMTFGIMSAEDLEVALTKGVHAVLNYTDGWDELADALDDGKTAIDNTITPGRDATTTMADYKAGLEALYTHQKDTINAEKDMKTAMEEATRAAKEKAGVLLSLGSSVADYYSKASDYQSIIDGESTLQTELAGMRASFGQQQQAEAESLADELERIEQEKQEKLHWVDTGAHERTAEEQQAARDWHAAIYDQMKTDAITKSQEKTDGIIAEQQRAEASQRTAMENEKAEAQAHLNELKLMTALSVMETTGELEKMTGLVGISAGQAVELISAGVLPVTQNMGMAIQTTMADMESSMTAATQTAADNQTILQDAFAGTLGSAADLKTGIDTIGSGEEAGLPMAISKAKDVAIALADAKTPAQELADIVGTIGGGGGEEGDVAGLGSLLTDVETLNTQFSDTLPTNIQTVSDALAALGGGGGGEDGEDVVSGLGLIASDATALSAIFGETLPESITTTAEGMTTFLDDTLTGLENIFTKTGEWDTQLLTATDTTIPGVDTAMKTAGDNMLTKLGLIKTTSKETADAMGTDFKTAADAAKKLIDELKTVDDWLVDIRKHAEAAEKALLAMMHAKGASGVDNESSYSSSAAGFAEGSGGWRTVPGGYPNDSFMMGLTTGEKFAVIPPGGGMPTLPMISGGFAGGGGGGDTYQIGPVFVETNNPQKFFEAIEREARARGKQFTVVN